jgi:NADP-reducing hydrogenase subunit HndD
VEVEGARNLRGVLCLPRDRRHEDHTNTQELRQARRDIIELILDNHPLDCHTCERDGNCELQRLASSMGIRARHFEGERKIYDKDLSSDAVIRDPDKCILCGRCVRMCSEIQQVHNLTQAHRGFNTVVMPAYDMPMGESVCTACGQCINVCPPRRSWKRTTPRTVQKLNDPDLIKVAQFAPSVRAAIGEAFGLAPGRNMEGELVAALRKLGFDYVFDTQFSADLTIMEEGSEFLERVQNGGKLPMITSCSSAWMKCMEQFYPDLIDNISTCKSPMSMQGALTKTYFARRSASIPRRSSAWR